MEGFSLLMVNGIAVKEDATCRKVALHLVKDGNSTATLLFRKREEVEGEGWVGN